VKAKKIHADDRLAVIGFIAPVVLMMLVFLTIPVIKALSMSFQYWYLSKPSPRGNYFIGGGNYLAVFQDPYFANSVRITLVYIVVTVIARYLLGFGAALLLNQQFSHRGIARSLIIIPWAVPEVVACLVWILMYDKDYGIINHILRNAGMLKANIGYLQDPKVALAAAMAVNIWKGFPFVAIMLLAGFQSISTELYEAASIDGANAGQKLRSITIPGVKPVSKVVFLLLVIWTVKDYAIAFCLAHGGPSRATEILTIYIQQTAFKYFDFGRAAAAGVIMLVFSIIFTALYFEIIDRQGGTE
jgi:multiple sugar transport system permease protein